MKNQMLLTIIFLAIFFPRLVFCDQTIQYEPAITELTGTLQQGKFQHPNGSWVSFYLIKLKTPVNINADLKNEINSKENGIVEIQLFSDVKTVQSKLKSKVGKSVTVKGTVFHEHTAWHVRPLVMSVSYIQ